MRKKILLTKFSEAKLAGWDDFRTFIEHGSFPNPGKALLKTGQLLTTA